MTGISDKALAKLKVSSILEEPELLCLKLRKGGNKILSNCSKMKEKVASNTASLLLKASSVELSFQKYFG